MQRKGQCLYSHFRYDENNNHRNEADICTLIWNLENEKFDQIMRDRK